MPAFALAIAWRSASSFLITFENCDKKRLSHLWDASSLGCSAWGSTSKTRALENPSFTTSSTTTRSKFGGVSADSSLNGSDCVEGRDMNFEPKSFVSGQVNASLPRVPIHSGFERWQLSSFPPFAKDAKDGAPSASWCRKVKSAVCELRARALMEKGMALGVENCCTMCGSQNQDIPGRDPISR
jgi:hypothetical protein